MKRLAVGIGIAAGACSLPVLLGGCSPEVVVGMADRGAAGACGGCLEEKPSSLGGCEAPDEQARSKYDAWRTTPNDLGLFAGTVWKGRVAAEAKARAVGVEAVAHVEIEVHALGVGVRRIEEHLLRGRRLVLALRAGAAGRDQQPDAENSLGQT